MPEVKFKHVVSCNSEDKQFPASNLILSESFKKWKCLPGAEQAAIILQFDHAVKIHSLDIGNCGSAFVEILGGHSASASSSQLDNNDAYDLLLSSQSFMSPTESRSETNANRVRMFNDKDHFEAEAIDKKYDRLKIICTQPYNKNIGFGLAFIRCCSFDQNVTKAANNQNPFVKIAPVDDVDDDAKPNFAPGSLFKQRARIEDKPKFQLSEKIPFALNSEPGDEKKLVKQRNVSKVEKLKRDDENKVKNQQGKTEKVSLKPTEDRQIEIKRQKTINEDANKLRNTPTTGHLSTKKQDSSGATNCSPFQRLFTDIIFVLSGFENPYRSQLRDKAIEMGANYQPDWVDGRCTHLICAFADTPKYNQVKGKGKIVKHQWILDSYKQKKRLNWKDYAFEGSLSKGKIYIDDEELVDEREKPKSHDDVKSKAKSDAENKTRSQDSMQKPTSSKNVIEDDVYDLPTDNSDEESPMDTDEELERVKKKQQQKQKSQDDTGVKKTKIIPSNSKKAESPPAAAQHDKTDTALKFDKDGLPILPDFFEKMVFMIYGGDVSKPVRKQLYRYIIAFGGFLETYMKPQITHILTKETWNDNFDEALAENPKLIFVDPTWVLECGRLEKMVDVKKYLISR